MDGAPLLLQPPPLGHAEAVLLVDDGEAEVAEDHLVLEQGVGADRHRRRARGQGGQLLGTDGALVASGEDDDLNSLGFKRLRQGLEVLSGEDFGRRHQGGLAPARRHVGHGQHGHHGLARAHVALHQPRHASARGQVGAELGQGPGLGPGQGEGQGGLHPIRQAARRDRRGRLPLADRLALLHRQLMGQQFVERQATPDCGPGLEVGGGGRRVQGGQGVAPAGPALAGEPGRVLPFGQLRGAGQGVEHDPAHLPRRQTGGRRIDRLQQRDLVRPVERQHVVGVGDGQLDVEPLGLAGHRPAGAHRVLPRKMVSPALEPVEENEAGLISGSDPVGPPRASRREVGVYRQAEHLWLAFPGAGHGGRPPLDKALRLQERHVAHQGSRQPLDQRGELGPHALQRARGREQGEQNLRPHAVQHSGAGVGTYIGRFTRPRPEPVEGEGVAADSESLWTSG